MYLGIELSGNGCVSSAVRIERNGDGHFHFSLYDDSWKGQDGLERLASEARGARRVAVGQPFSYPVATMDLLTSRSNGDELSVPDCLWRRTDAAMRQLLQAEGSSAHFLKSPTGCRILWRALALAHLAGLSGQEVRSGQGRIVETQPRVALTLLMNPQRNPVRSELVARYKRMGPKSRYCEQLLEIFTLKTRIRASRRLEKVDDQQLEALLCAYVAMLHDRRQTRLAGFEDPDDELLRREGAAVLPKEPWQF